MPGLSSAKGKPCAEQPAPAPALSFHRIHFCLTVFCIPHRLGPLPTRSGKGMSQDLEGLLFVLGAHMCSWEESVFEHSTHLLQTSLSQALRTSVILRPEGLKKTWEARPVKGRS